MMIGVATTITPIIKTRTYLELVEIFIFQNKAVRRIKEGILEQRGQLEGFFPFFRRTQT
jgi:hypothetical protein